MIKGIIIFGPNGSGKTTLGRELAEKLNYKYMDIEDYHFLKSDIPYTKFRSKDIRNQLILEDMVKHEKFVLSALTGDFTDQIMSFYDLAVYISAPLEVRLKRIKNRAYLQHGERILKGGDMHDQENEFFSHVKNKSLVSIEAFKDQLKCPIIYLDGENSLEDNLENLLNSISKISY
ncbi:AAA family ATPase [Acidaminobacter sp. JC074]|uniref:AAA family ATPase n=1 Tax=Acidaminobacter sp. JC074 TaxID=2530199 RepID=UPI001F10F4D7|nr:AAA family ATPase [Acidaminobacter sp. JC074]MCH4888035.1 AAA family ATPase [Acidaminobacter sp. JC074]